MNSQSRQFSWDICGHEKIVGFLQSAIINQKVSHAYLFVGPAHLGKYTVAREFIASFFCEAGGGVVPCGECVHCQELRRGVHPDVYLVEKAIDEKTGKIKKDIIIEQIRNLRGQLQQATLLNNYKVAIIPEAQFINTNAANALLKVLEEPTAKTVLILITDDIRQLPPTIASRCQAIKFLPVADKTIENYLAGRGVSEAKALARLSYGRPGVAVTLASEPEFLAGRYQHINLLFQTIGASIGQRFDLIDNLIEWGKDERANVEKTNALLDDWQSVLRDWLFLQSDNEPLVANINHLSALNQHQKIFSFQKIKDTLQRIKEAKTSFAQNINSRTALENLIINL